MTRLRSWTLTENELAAILPLRTPPGGITWFNGPIIATAESSDVVSVGGVTIHWLDDYVDCMRSAGWLD